METCPKCGYCPTCGRSNTPIPYVAPTLWNGYYCNFCGQWVVNGTLHLCSKYNASSGAPASITHTSSAQGK